MPHFNRLTDIVTCNLTALLDGVADPAAVLTEIISEMKEGIAGADRCVTTAARNMKRIESEIAEQKQELARWMDEARQQLEAGEDDRARQSLFRKREVADLITALDEQHRAATATRDHLLTTLNALQARLVDAQRRLTQLHTPGPSTAVTSPSLADTDLPSTDDRRQAVEAELEELRQAMRK